MAGNADHARAPLAPPRLAYALLAIAAGASHKAVLIGDLQEEFYRLSRKSPRAARAWYWRQVSRSVPHLLLDRMRTDRMRKIGLAALAVLAAFSLISLWDIMIARNAARNFAALSDAPSYMLVRAVYLGAQMLGVAIAGGVIAGLTFRPQDSFMRNAIRRLAPAALVLFAPSIIAIFNPADHYTTSFRLLWIGLAAPTLTAGAGCVVWLRRR